MCVLGIRIEYSHHYTGIRTCFVGFFLRLRVPNKCINKNRMVVLFIFILDFSPSHQLSLSSHFFHHIEDNEELHAMDTTFGIK